MTRKQEPDRKCIFTGEIRPKNELIRFVVGPDGVIVPDISERLPGRGLWLTARRDIIEDACAKNVFSKVARAKISIPEELPSRLEKLIRQRCLEIFGLARRAGKMVGGYEKVRSFLSKEAAGALVAASDGAADGRIKIEALAPGVPVIECFTGGELGAAIGRDRLVHAVIGSGGFAFNLLTESDRYKGLLSSAVDG